jgi:two-component system, NtrC family, nitrogen regulation sensor histidine kinase NtrY
MFSRNIYINILLRVAVIVALSIILGYIAFVLKQVRLTIICSGLLFVVTLNLVLYLNKTNRKMRFFFDSIRNDDSGLNFPDKTGSHIIDDLSEGMNRVNRQIQTLKIENRQQEQYFSTLIEHLAVGIITYNDKGFIIHSNSAAKKLLGMDVLTHTEQLSRKHRSLYNIVTAGVPVSARSIPVSSSNGDTELALRGTSFRMQNEEVMILSLQDIKEELDEKEVDSWMKLIRVLMHEIMNSITPVTSVSGSLLNIYKPGGEDITPASVTEKTIATTIQGLSVIKDQGKGLMSFVSSYRKLTRVPEPHLSLFRVSELLDRIRVVYESPDDRNGARLDFILNDPLITLNADQNLISQVLINLIKNSIEAQDNASTIAIKVVAGADKTGRPEICVIDNGPGIAAEDIDEIFIPFFTTKNNGTGIGLSISRQIMKAHGGNLKVRSVPGVETVFCMTF